MTYIFKKILKIRAEINAKETKETMRPQQKSTKPKAGSLKG